MMVGTTFEALLGTGILLFFLILLKSLGFTKRFSADIGVLASSVSFVRVSNMVTLCSRYLTSGEPVFTFRKHI